MTHQVTFESLPKTLDELKALPQAALTRPEDTAALTIAALCVYPTDPAASIAMLDFLRGPRPLSPMEQQFIRDRFMDGRDYLARSYFDGATPDNGYTPTQPFTLTFSDSASPMAEEGYRKLDIRSGGADSPRQVMLRLKPSTGQWFLWEQYLLSQIRIPTSADPWA